MLSEIVIHQELNNITLNSWWAAYESRPAFEDPCEHPLAPLRYCILFCAKGGRGAGLTGGTKPLLVRRIRVRIVTGSRTILSIAYYSTCNKWMMTHL